MVDNVGIYDYNGNTYAKRSEAQAYLGFITASAASALLYKALPSFSNPFLKQISKEHANNHLYKDVFQKAVELSGLEEKGLQVHNMFLNSYEATLPKEKVANYDVKAAEKQLCYAKEDNDKERIDYWKNQVEIRLKKHNFIDSFINKFFDF